MFIHKLLLASFLISIASTGSEARVFSFDKTTFGTYLKGNYALTHTMGEDFYETDGGADTSFSGEPSYILGGEIGLLIRTGVLGFRLGVNVLAPEPMLDKKGKNSSGTTLMTVDSNITGIVPALHVEFYLHNTDTTTVFLSAGAGSGTVTYVNKYDLNSDGEAAYGVSDYTQEASGLAIQSEAALGFEFHFSANATMMFDAGYRYLVVNKFTQSRSVEGADGDISKGDVVKDTDGKNLSLDMSGAFAGFGLRFYFL